MGLKLKMTIDGAKYVDNGIWRATLDPEEAATLGECVRRSGPYSVLMIDSAMDFNPSSRAITFDPNSIILLNIGSSDQAIILSTETIQETEEPDTALNTDPSEPPVEEPPTPADTDLNGEKIPEMELSQTLSTGDKLFLSELPAGVRDLGETLLSEVRRLFPGELNYEPRSAKFDETPSIFWTIKILPGENALRITVRGTPESFDPVSGIDLQLDKFGYSAFLVNRRSQISSALSIIKQAHDNME